jgi:KAP family P-loop domain
MSAETTADDSPPVSDNEVRNTLKGRLAHLSEQPWFGELCRIQQVEKEAVGKCVAAHIDSVKEVDNLYRLGTSYACARSRLDRYKDKRPIYAGAVFSLCIISVFLVLGIEVSENYFFGLYFSIYTGALPFLLSYLQRRRNNLLTAPAAESKAATDLDRGMRSLIDRSVREVTELKFIEPYKDYVKICDGARLSSRVQRTDRIATRYRPAVELHMLRAGGAAVGVTGERGMGKSELLRSFCDDPVSKATIKNGGTIGVFVAVPAAFKGIEFLTLVAERLAQEVPGYRSPGGRQAMRKMSFFATSFVLAMLLFAVGAYLLVTRKFPTLTFTAFHLGFGLLLLGVVLFAIFAGEFFDVLTLTRTFARGSKGPSDVRASASGHARSRVGRDAEQLMTRLQYAETISAQTEGSVGWGSIGLNRTRQRSLSALPLTEASLILEIETLADKLAAAGYRVVIGVDEMDKLEGGQATENFLNSVKQLFSISSCSFLVSVSSSAWARFVQRGINVRDALDSSLDAIESIDALDFCEARSLILHRHEEMSDSQVLFCYTLAGGLPREIMRCARSLAMRNRDEEGGSHALNMVADRVLNTEFDRLMSAIRNELAVWEFPDRDRLFRVLDGMTPKWTDSHRSQSGDDGSVAPPGHRKVTSSAARIREGQVIVARLDLMTQFFNVMRRLFCVPTAEIVNEAWEKGGQVILEVCHEMGKTRRLVETDPTAARQRLLKINNSLDMLAEPGAGRSDTAFRSS